MLLKNKGSAFFQFLRNQQNNTQEIDKLSEKLKKTYNEEKNSKRKVIFLERASDDLIVPKKWKDLDKQTKQYLLKKYMNEKNIIGKISDYAISRVVYSHESKKIKSLSIRKL